MMKTEKFQEIVLWTTEKDAKPSTSCSLVIRTTQIVLNNAFNIHAAKRGRGEKLLELESDGYDWSHSFKTT